MALRNPPIGVLVLEKFFIISCPLSQVFVSKFLLSVATFEKVFVS
jgi:hypothetical protein